MRRMLPAAAWLVFALALPVQAQPVADPIAALLFEHRGAEPGDAEEPDTAGQPPEPLAPLPPLPPLPPPQRSRPPASRPQLTAPVFIEETGKTPDAPPSLRDMAYDTRIKSSFYSAKGFQGPLEGGWTLAGEGIDLYALQLVDRADRLEGAWRDVRRKGSLNASGLVDDLQRSGGDVTIRITPEPGAAASVAVLHSAGDGLWTGNLTEAGRVRPVTLRRAGL